jgi:ATP-dependent helicase/nuclease subunit A
MFCPGTSVLVDGRVIAGTMDRLVVDGNAVRVIDYKTGQSVPATAEEVPLGYLRQMAAYASALAVIFPDHRIEAALLFTGGPRLIDLPPALLALHKPTE